ncbi:MAG: glycosyltransferase [Candidatus Promineofilum sp.]|nr:glycosyltransferase [Promineifilum sp.]
MNLVHIPFHDWKKCEREGFRTRDAHFMQEFARHRAVDRLLIINRPISAAEVVLLRRNWRPRQGETFFQDGDVCITQVGPNTYTVDVLIRELVKPLRMKRSWTPYIFGQPDVAAAVETALKKLSMDSDYALFLSAPLFAPLIPRLSPQVVGFDAQDNLLKHAFYQDIPDLASYYDFLLERGDFISANSPETTNWFKQKRPDARHISNGVDKNVFSPNRAFQTPFDMESIPGPIVGYAGKMQEMFDVDLMSHIVQQLPDVNFVFIGQELNSSWVKPLWQHSNAHYLGDKPYDQLPHYLAAFDVCTIPYNQERQHGVDPIKFYEYLAMGKPVVTTNIGGVSVFRDFPQVRIAEDVAGFLEGVRYFTDAIRQGRAIPISELPEAYTWRAKADEIIQSLLLKQRA